MPFHHRPESKATQNPRQKIIITRQARKDKRTVVAVAISGENNVPEIAVNTVLH